MAFNNSHSFPSDSDGNVTSSPGAADHLPPHTHQPPLVDDVWAFLQHDNVVLSSPDTDQYDPNSASRVTYTTQTTNLDSPTPAQRGQSAQEACVNDRSYPPFAHNYAVDDIHDVLHPYGPNDISPNQPRRLLSPTLQDDDVPDFEYLPAPLVSSAMHPSLCPKVVHEITPKRWNVNSPPYNLLGPFAHECPELCDDYAITDNMGRRSRVWYNAMVYRAVGIPDHHKHQYRVHAEKPTNEVFLEFKEGHEFSINYQKLNEARSPLHSKLAYCPHDGVYGLYTRWRDVSEATWFLYYCFKLNLVEQAPHSHMRPMPPRFVNGYGGFNYSKHPIIDLDNPDAPTGPQYDDYTKKLMDNFYLFDITMLTRENKRWRHTPPEMRDTRPAPVIAPKPTLKSLSMHGGGPNTIIVWRINEGHDVRTTVMMRNIPNQATLQQLKATLDRYVHGEYDFLYLRADFKTGNNVGYCFINFTSTTPLLRFCIAMDGRPLLGWEASKKEVMFAYADCQGSNTLVDRFRNSAIMNEQYDRRPHLYYTVDDVTDQTGHGIVGLEKPFPFPDNLTRLKRSEQRTELEGLFAGGSRRRGGVAAVEPVSEVEALEAVVRKYKDSLLLGSLLAWIAKGGY